MLKILHRHRQPETHRIDVLEQPVGNLRLLADHRLDLAQRRILLHHRQQPQHAQIIGAAHRIARHHQFRDLPATHRIGAPGKGLLHRRQTLDPRLHHRNAAATAWPDQPSVFLLFPATALGIHIHHGQPEHPQQLLRQRLLRRALQHHPHATLVQQEEHLLMLRILGHGSRHLHPQPRNRFQLGQCCIEFGLRRGQQQRVRLQRPVIGHQPVQRGQRHRRLVAGTKTYLQRHDAPVTVDHRTITDQQTGQRHQRNTLEGNMYVWQPGTSGKPACIP